MLTAPLRNSNACGIRWNLRLENTAPELSGIEKIKERLKSITSGTGLRAKKLDDLFDQISGHPDPLTGWQEILAELETLALASTSEDADLVISCDYRTAGDQSGGQIKSRGAIDMDEIRTEITSVMEGGKQAFRLRKEKYGF